MANLNHGLEYDSYLVIDTEKCAQIFEKKISVTLNFALCY